MALLNMDFPDNSTGLYGTDKSKMLDGLYAQIGNSYTSDMGFCAIVSDPDSNKSGLVFRCDTNSYGGGNNRITARRVLKTPTNVLHMASRVWLSALPQEGTERPILASFKNSGNNIIIEVIVTTTGALGIRRNNTTIATSSPLLTANAWAHVEVKLATSATPSEETGEVTVWIEGVERYKLSGIYTPSATIAQVERGVDPSVTSSNPAIYFKEMVEQDTTGSSNNGQIGPRTLIDLTPDSDVSSGWTSTESTDYEAITGSGVDDTNYIEADDTPPEPAIVGLSNLPADIVGVRGLQIYHRSWKTDSGDGSIQTAVSPNGTDWDSGSDRPVTTTPTFYSDMSELSPDTGTAWTPIEVNDLTLRIDRTI